MDYVDYLSAEAKSDIAALHQFIILSGEGSDDLHLFFEGEEDSLFYVAEIRRRIGSRKINVYVCGGKSNVQSVRNDISTKGYDYQSCLFFVDRDYDDYTNSQISIDDRTFLTDGYSIENYVCSENGADVIVSDIVRLSRADPLFQEVLDTIERGIGNYQQKLRALSAWCIAAKVEGLRPNFNNVKDLNSILKVQPDGNILRMRTGFRKFKSSVLGQGDPPSILTSIRIYKSLNLTAGDQWIRGKFCSMMFRRLLVTALDQASERRKAAGGKALRISASIRDGKFLELLGGRMAPPASLAQFLDHALSAS